MRAWFSFLKPKQRESALRICEKCSGTSLKRTIATYPVPLTGRLAGRRVDVYRVELDRCRQCGHLMPTPAGQAKIKRCVKVGKKAIFDSILNSLPTDVRSMSSPMAKPQAPCLSQHRSHVKAQHKPPCSEP